MTDRKKATFPTIATAGAGTNEPTIAITTAALDRDGDVIVPEGIDLTAYRRNPVVMFGHDLNELPVGTTTSIDVSPGQGIRARWKWLENDARAARVRNAYEQGVLRAASIGFRPLDWEPIAGSRGVKFLRSELYEWSLVPVGANAEAVRTLKALGLTNDRDDLVLDIAAEPLTLDIAAEPYAHLNEPWMRLIPVTGELQRRIDVERKAIKDQPPADRCQFDGGACPMRPEFQARQFCHHTACPMPTQPSARARAIAPAPTSGYDSVIDRIAKRLMLLEDLSDDRRARR